MFALHHDESPSREALSSPLDSPDGTALNNDIFRPRSDDEQPGISQNDQAFLDIMHKRVGLTSDGYIQLTLPFKHSKCPLSNNSNADYGRTHNTLVQLVKHEWKITQIISAMQHNINEGCVEQVPEERPVTTPVASLATSIVMKKNPSPLSPLLQKVSDFNKLIRITMIVLRWKTLIKSTKRNPITREIAIKCLERYFIKVG